jgi:acyl-CoA thioesterase-1
MKNIFIASLLANILFLSSYAQKKVVILGSSTAYGKGASVEDSSWAVRLQTSFRKNIYDGIDTIVENRAMPGYVTYNGLPDNYTMPANRSELAWAPDPLRNITSVLNEYPKPDVVILSYPSNDANLPDYKEKETMDNLRLMYQRLTDAGIRCFVTSTQPRNDMSDDQRRMLRELRDSIINNFKLNSINYWDELATTDGLNRLREELMAVDGVHPNDIGHRLIFQRVQSKNIFGTESASLPLLLKNWQARLENNIVKLKWSTYSEEPNTIFEIQRTDNGKDFKTLYLKKGTGGNADYSWDDIVPFNGKSIYRLKITEPGKTSFSPVIAISNTTKKQLITNLSVNSSSLQMTMNSTEHQSALFSIINYSGAVVKQVRFTLTASSTTVSIPVSELPSGDYFLRATLSDGTTSVERFAKLK